MGATRMAGLAIVAAVIIFRLLSNPTVGTMVYIAVSALMKFDSDIVPYKNFDGEIEDGKFLHRFTPLTQTASGMPVNITYHSVECGAPDAEPIIFLHGLAETWIVWKDIMLPFCDTHRPIAIDIEGMGQSYWPSVLNDLKGNSRDYYGDLELGLFIKLGAERFNLVVSDYGFWSSMNMLLSKTADGQHRVLRYGKFQSTAGVDDTSRIPQAFLLFYAPETMNFVLNANPHALARILMNKALLPLPSVRANHRVGLKEIDDDVFHRYILRGIQQGIYSSWVWFYHFGNDMVAQMTLQLQIFEQIDYPVSMIQGKLDLGQPYRFFDGSTTFEIVESPPQTIRDKLFRNNRTHTTRVDYSADGEVIGPTAVDFFPNSPWKKFEFLDEVGHFIHLEAPEKIIESLRELLLVPVAH